MNPFRSRAALSVALTLTVLGCGSDATGVSKTPNPTPVLASISPDTTVAGSAAVEVTAIGSGFDSLSRIAWGASTLSTTFSDSSHLVGVIPASDLTTPESASVIVATPAPGGGVSAGRPFLVVPPVPTVSSVTPDTVTEGVDSFSVSVLGDHFVPASVVLWNGAPAPTSFVGTSQLRAVVAGAQLVTPGPATISVRTPPRGGGTSAADTVSVLKAPPTPVLDSLSPDSSLNTAAPLTLTLFGRHLSTGSQVRWNGTLHAATWTDSTRLTLGLSSTDIASPGTVSVDVRKGPPGGGESDTLSFRVILDPPPPVVQSLGTDTITATAAGAQFQVVGSAFRGTVVAIWDSQPVPTSLVSSSALTITVPYGLVSLTTPSLLQVADTGAYGKSSGAISVDPKAPIPVIASFSPDTFPEAFDTTIVTATGQHFLPATGKLDGLRIWRGGQLVGPVTWHSPTQVTFAVPAGFPLTAGANILAGYQGVAATFDTLWMKYPHPVIDSLIPRTVSDGATSFFVVGDSLTPTTILAIDGTPIEFDYEPWNHGLEGVIDPPLPAGKDSVTVTVQNPGPGGGNASAILHVVARPVVDSIVGTPLRPSTDSLAVTIRGHKLRTNSTATWTHFLDTPYGPVDTVPATITDSVSATVRLPPAALQPGTLIGVALQNPAPLPGASAYAVAQVWDSGVKQVSQMSLLATILAADTLAHRLYAIEYDDSFGTMTGPFLTQIDPVGDSVLRRLPLGTVQPMDLRLTRDGQFAWITMRYESKVLRVDLTNWSIDTQISMENDDAGHPWVPYRVCPMPDGSVVVLRQSISNVGLPASVAVYDGTLRRTQTFRFHEGPDLDLLPVGTSDTVVALFGGGVDPQYFILKVSAGGLDSLAAFAWPGGTGYGQRDQLFGDWIADGAGDLVEWRTGTVAGTNLAGAVLPEAAGSRIFQLNSDPGGLPPQTLSRRTSPSDNSPAIRRWPALDVAANAITYMARWSSDGIGFLTPGHAWIVKADLIAP